MNSENGITVLNNGLDFSGSVPYETWEKKGKELHGLIKLYEANVRWWIGDWMVYGERAYPERYSQALEADMYSSGTVRNCAYVCRNVPPENRVNGLSFDHHYLVAKMPSEEQRRFLAEAAENMWSVRDLSRAIKGLSPQKALPDKVEPFNEAGFTRWWELNSERLKTQSVYDSCLEAWNHGTRE